MFDGLSASILDKYGRICVKRVARSLPVVELFAASVNCNNFRVNMFAVLTNFETIYLRARAFSAIKSFLFAFFNQ